MKSREKFELDEPAARTHAPSGWPVQTIEIKPSGRAPKQYGPNVYRFCPAMTLSVILPRRGWTLIKQTKNYAYLKPPADHVAPPFYISIAVPTAAECLELARRSYARSESWMGQLGEWPAWYLHQKNSDLQEVWRDPATGQAQTRLHANPPISRLMIGEYGPWYANVDDRTGKFVVHGTPTSGASQPAGMAMAVPLLLEGGPKSLELTSYERSASARRLCIEHYGPQCQACGLKYEEKYGAIGADMIHVHHVTPLSEIGETYKVDPIRDLIPLCATCHHVAHGRVPPYTVSEIRGAIEAAKSYTGSSAFDKARCG